MVRCHIWRHIIPPNPTWPGRDEHHPTTAELDADVSIDADFDDVVQAVIDGHGTKSNQPRA